MQNAFLLLEVVTSSRKSLRTQFLLFETAVELDPEKYEAMIELGKALNTTEKYDDAEEILEKATKLKPEESEGFLKCTERSQNAIKTIRIFKKLNLVPD